MSILDFLNKMQVMYQDFRQEKKAGYEKSMQAHMNRGFGIRRNRVGVFSATWAAIVLRWDGMH